MIQESEKVELKEIYTDEIKKEAIAFANTDGGIIYVGIADHGEIIGLDDIDDTDLKIMNSCRDSIKPDITMFMKSEHLVLEGKDVLAIHIHRGTSRPYYLSAKGLKSSGVFVRQGTSSAQASDLAIRNMIKESDGDHFEDMRSLEQDLTFHEATIIFAESKMDFGKIQMKTLGLINQENIYTNLGLLLSDQCPHIIKIAKFAGSDQNEFQDRKECTGSLFKQLKEAYEYLKLRNQISSKYEGLLRIDIQDYSDLAIRETLINSIVHRDYSLSASTLISIFQDKIEFLSYGGLVNDITLDDILFGLSVCRNQKLANIFYRLNLIEAYGTGLKKIRDSYKKTGLSPEFLTTKNAFKVILPNRNYVNKIAVGVKENEQKKMIVDYLQKNGTVSRPEIENLLQITSSGAIRVLKKYKDENLLIQIGKGKNTYYILRD